jgi:hypothetical protein
MYTFKIPKEKYKEIYDIVAENENEAIDIIMNKLNDKDNSPASRKFYKDSIRGVRTIMQHLSRF